MCMWLGLLADRPKLVRPESWSELLPPQVTQLGGDGKSPQLCHGPHRLARFSRELQFLVSVHRAVE